MKEGEKAASVWLVEAGKWKSTKLDGRQTTRPRDPGRARRAVAVKLRPRYRPIRRRRRRIRRFAWFSIPRRLCRPTDRHSSFLHSLSRLTGTVGERASSHSPALPRRRRVT